MKISKYNPENDDDIFAAITKDPDWEMFSKNAATESYRKSLKNSVTYVCYNGNEFCGYLRAIPDDGFAVYVSELFVIHEWRNHKIGQSLLERIKSDYSGLSVYVLSDEDAFYVKKGYTKIGSVFEI